MKSVGTIWRGMGVLCLVLAGFSVFPYIALAGNTNAEALLSLTNKYRVSQGLNPISNNAQLEAAARERANELLEKGYFGHQDGRKNRYWIAARDAGYEDILIGENLACGFSWGVRYAFKSWLKSSSHKENLLDPRWNDVGIAVVRGNLNYKLCNHDNDYVIVAVFGGKP